MATNTTNYNLVKPAYADTADIADINGNMDIIDGQMKTNADGVSSTNSSLAKTEAGLAVIVTGDTCPLSVPAGGYAYIKSNTHGLTEGLYRNKTGSVFPTSGGMANSTVFEPVSRGGINALKSDIDTLNGDLNGKTKYESFDIKDYLTRSDGSSDIRGRIARFGNAVTITMHLGSLSLSAGSNTIGTFSKFYPSWVASGATPVFAVGTIGAATDFGNHVRLELDGDGVLKAISSIATTSTLRATLTFTTGDTWS